MESPQVVEERQQGTKPEVAASAAYAQQQRRVRRYTHMGAQECKHPKTGANRKR